MRTREREQAAHSRDHLDGADRARRFRNRGGFRALIVGACYLDLVRCEIRAVCPCPRHGLYLAQTQPREDGDGEERTPPRGCREQETPDLGKGPYTQVPPGGREPAQLAGRIRRHPSPLDGGLEDF